MKAIKGLSRTKEYTYYYLKHLGIIAAFAYLISNALRVLRSGRYVITDKVPILLPTKAGLLFCTFEDLSVLWEVFCERVYSFSTHPKIVVDVGAHIGIFTLYVKKVCPYSQIIAVEPCPLSFRLLKLNMRLTKLSNIIVVPYALSLSRGCTTLYSGLGWRGVSTTKLEFAKHFTKHGKTILKVPTITLDDLARSMHVTSIDLIKIDVEGAELDVLKGGSETLTRTKELVIAAYHTPTEADEIEVFLRERRFNVRRYHAGGATYIYAVNIWVKGG